MTERRFRVAVRTLTERDPALAAIVARFGRPPLWRREPGFATLVLLILEQQVSLASARAAFDRLETEVGDVVPESVLALDDVTLRAIGFSRQKAGYARALASSLVEGTLDLDALPLLPDGEVRSRLLALPGIGPWTADVYLLACLSRPDSWPVGDVALQAATQQALGLASGRRRESWRRSASAGVRTARSRHSSCGTSIWASGTGCRGL